MWSRVKKRPSSSIYSFDEKEKTLYEKEKMGTVYFIPILEINLIILLNLLLNELEGRFLV